MRKLSVHHLPYRWLLIIIGLVIIDQVTKQLAITQLPLRKGVFVLPGLVFYLCYNSGIGFSLFADHPTLLTVIATVILAYTLKALHESHKTTHSSLTSLGLTFILGGGFSNLYDRLTLGAVIDFISIYFLGWKGPIFNVADIAITLGFLLIFLSEMRLKFKSQRVS